MPACRFVATDQPRALKGRHLSECAGDPCPGCEPCPDRHCQACGHRHVDELTCPECLGEARADLHRIRDTAPRLLGEAVHRGIESEAAHLDGATAHPEAWRQRRRFGFTPHADDVIGETHPLWTLGTWDLLVTEHYGHHRAGRVTIASAVAYLDTNLADLAQDDDFAFDDLATDLRTCRGHLEDVLIDGDQTSTGAPCMACGSMLQKPAKARHDCTHDTPARRWLKILRTYPEIVATAAEQLAAREACKDCDQGGQVDHWECPRCRQRHTEDQYRFAVMQLHRDEAEWLTDRDMEIRTGVKAGTVREWARRGHVDKRRDSGRVVFRVAQVVERGGIAV